ncbi:hypothetical protein F5Y01DRAFT_312427 [Xylaria sp. FL0043]|nr:hypothetical protein F5Y01DRAFT_312427 [Xylaria sp. FL0043]
MQLDGQSPSPPPPPLLLLSLSVNVGNPTTSFGPCVYVTLTHEYVVDTEKSILLYSRLMLAAPILYDRLIHWSRDHCVLEDLIHRSLKIRRR